MIDYLCTLGLKSPQIGRLNKILHYTFYILTKRTKLKSNPDITRWLEIQNVICCNTMNHLWIKFLGKSETQLASHVLQFLFLSDCGFRFPVTQFPSHDCTASDLFLLFWKGIGMMKEYGFKWVGFTNSMHLIKLLVPSATVHVCLFEHTQVPCY